MSSLFHLLALRLTKQRKKISNKLFRRWEKIPVNIISSIYSSFRDIGKNDKIKKYLS